MRGTKNADIDTITPTHSNSTPGTKSGKSRVEKMGGSWSRRRNRRKQMIHFSTTRGVRKRNTKRKGVDNGYFNGEIGALNICKSVTLV